MLIAFAIAIAEKILGLPRIAKNLIWRVQLPTFQVVFARKSESWILWIVHCLSCQQRAQPATTPFTAGVTNGYYPYYRLELWEHQHTAESLLWKECLSAVQSVDHQFLTFKMLPPNNFSQMRAVTYWLALQTFQTPNIKYTSPEEPLQCV